MNVLSAENLSKSYGEKTLFDDISFNINDYDKIGLIGVNGTGKTSLLNIIAGVDVPDSGTIASPKGTKIEYLSQDPEFDEDATILQQVFKGDSPALNVIRAYESALDELSRQPEDDRLQEKITKLTSDMNTVNAWELESQIKTILTRLGVRNFEAKMGTLSGGQKKRVALASALINPCDLLILDEPTNHMDNDTIEWLENYLKNRKGALLMITHDRYFLDRVVNKTLELDFGKLYIYTGNYTEFVEKKIERKNLESTMESKRQNLYKKELEWIRTGAKARTTKQKARIQRFEEIKDSKVVHDDSKVEISVGHSRLGKKILEVEHISKSFGDLNLINDFSYILLREDRIGIIGDNGVGKSTLLNLLTGKLEIDNGEIDMGPTVKVGYFSQESEDMDTTMKAIEYIKESAEFITTADGTKISASQMMERFLFTSSMQWTYISKLSGGERRRLYLLKVLMDAPNVLILDEPTNDLDIDTLKVLENYIDEFSGAVIAVSHDRYFLDRICNKIFSFEGGGKIVDHVGNYSDYVDYRKLKEDELKAQQTITEIKEKPKRVKAQKLKFTYKEKMEYETIDDEIETLENQLSELEDAISKTTTDFVKLQELMTAKDKAEEDLLFKMERQEYLSNLEEEIKNQ